MTYIVGINKKEYEFVTVISDIMVTKRYPDGSIVRENTALKTGLLFKGCLYGLSGDADAGQDFLLGFKQKVNKTNSIGENVEEFKEYIRSAEWKKGKGFEILFAIRNPSPDLYLLDSNNPELVLCKESLVTLGSGRRHFRNMVSNMKKHADSTIMQALKEKRTPIVYYPCFMCLWLSEQTLGFESSYLEKIGVGGIFHYCYQTSGKEARHQPIIFVLFSFDKSTQKISHKAYRISFINGFLLVDYLTDKKRITFTSDVERKDLRGYSVQENREFLKEIYRRSDAMPLYYFCGFAIYDPRHRGYYRGHFSSSRGKKVIDKEGNIESNYLKEITDIFESPRYLNQIGKC